MLITHKQVKGQKKKRKRRDLLSYDNSTYHQRFLDVEEKEKEKEQPDVVYA